MPPGTSEQFRNVHGPAPVHLSHARLSKTYPAGKKVLDNVNLSFYPDAKIGVLGVNGSGKSTLMRIMAGLDTEFVGEGFVAEGARVGYLPQEPDLDPALDVKGNAMLGVKEKQAILDRYNELAMNYSDETADEMTQLQDEIEAKGLWDLESQVEQAMDALGCPPDDSDVTKLSGGERRRVALCRLLLEKPELLLLDEPTNHLDAETVELARRSSARLSGRDPYRNPRPLFPRQRDKLDSRARSRPRYSYEGNYSAWLVQKQKRLEQEGREDAARQRALAEESEWIASSPRARQTKSKARIAAYDELVRKSNEKAPTGGTDRHSGGRAAGPERRRPRRPQQRLRRPAPHRQAFVQAAARRHRRRHRRRTAPARPRFSA